MYVVTHNTHTQENFGAGKISEMCAIRQNFTRQYSQISPPLAANSCMVHQTFPTKNFSVYGNYCAHAK